MVDNKNKPAHKSRWLQKWNKIFSAISENKRNNPQPETITETQTEKKIREDRESLKKALEEFKTQTSLNVDPDKLTNAINNFQFYEAAILTADGYSDGFNGVKDANIKITAQSRAEFIFEHTRSILNGRIKGVNSEIATKNDQLGILNASYKEEQRFNNIISSLNKRKHRHFSAFMGVLYVIAGFFLLITDFPVSISISNIFLNLPPANKQNAQFFAKIQNPEILLFSLGFTLFGFYYKMFYDVYCNKSIIPDRFQLKGEDEVNHVPADRWRRLVPLLVNVAILFALLFLFFNVGYVRNAIRPEELDSDINNKKLYSFILTSILLPIVSGICLSLGFGIFSNRNNLRTSDRKLRKFEQEKLAIEAQVIKLNMTTSMLEALQECWAERDKKIKSLSDLFSNAYQRGFKLGHKAKFGDDFYNNVQAMFIDSVISKN